MSTPFTIVCAGCGAVQQPDRSWHKPATRPPRPYSHGSCPDCTAEFRAEMAALKPRLLREYPWARAVGCSALHPDHKDVDGGARVVEDEP